MALHETDTAPALGITVKSSPPLSLGGGGAVTSGHLVWVPWSEHTCTPAAEPAPCPDLWAPPEWRMYKAAGSSTIDNGIRLFTGVFIKKHTDKNKAMTP